MAAALVCGVALALAGGVVFGWFCVRLTGVHSAMLTLAFAADRLVGRVSVDRRDRRRQRHHRRLAGGLGRARRRASIWLCLIVCGGAAALLRAILFSPFGYALRALRDNRRARRDHRHRAPAACNGRRSRSPAALRALAGALFAFLKGSVFPDSLGIPLSIDGLVMVLLGGVDTVVGRRRRRARVPHACRSGRSATPTIPGSSIGALIIVLVLLFPRGLVGALAGEVCRR